jgi:hypothetical protein
MNKQAARPTIAVVLAALRSEDEKAHASAVEWRARFGDDPVRGLILEATYTRLAPRPPGPFGRIGSGADVDSATGLWALMRDDDREVQNTAAGLIGWLLAPATMAMNQGAGMARLPGGRPVRTGADTAAARSSSAAKRRPRRQARRADR